MKKTEKTRVQVMTINGHNVLIEATWIWLKEIKDWAYVGMRTVEVLD